VAERKAATDRACAQDRYATAWQGRDFAFRALGIVVMILSGAVAIYASHLHLWDAH
jgi:hypothetical protein